MSQTTLEKGMSSLRSKNEGLASAPAGRAVTLADIASEAGVSTVAVSVVLNNAQSKVRVSAATRERIMETAQRLQYRPNAVARSLRRRRTNILAFYAVQNVVLEPGFPFYGALLSGLLSGCDEHQKDFLLHGTFRDMDEDAIFLELMNGQIDGLIIYTRFVTPLVEKLAESHLPVVTVVHEVPGIPCVGIQNEEAGRLLARHIADKGYKRVLYRSTASDMPPTLERRLAAFTAEARLQGIEIMHSRCDTQWPSAEEKEILDSESERPDVVVAYSDFAADGVVDYCWKNGLKIPEDLAIAGFDDLPSNLRPARRLTTVSAPWREVTRHAVSLLVARCNGEDVPLRTELPVEIIEGDTT
ncbi:LacI family transcriptional regulator [bacterium]|nr:MAG: LacI family transcriptional regulator [bacterium]